MEEKLVSVIIPFFNRVSWLLEAIDSVQKQTYTNWELVLVNDGSTEDIGAVYSLAEANPQIHLINQKNAGVAAARNAGIAAASGYYIALLDSDDLWDPHKLKKQITYMEDNGYLVSHTCYTLFDEKGTTSEVDTGAMEGDLLKKLIISCPLNTSSAVAAKHLVDNLVPPFQVGYQYGEDACFWISLAAQTPIGVIREPLTHTRQTSTRAADDMKKVRIALVNILGFVMRSPHLSMLDTEIDIVSKKIALLTEAIQIQQEHQNNLDNKIRDLEPVREFVRNRFEKIGFFPKVSIIIPVYNGADYMRDAIDSALTQTYGNIEVIVVNDGSCDDGNTENIARTYGDRIRYFAKPNGGVATALNLGIEKMEGEYFSWLSHDDMYTPQKIEEEMNALASLNDHTTIIAEGYQVVDPFGYYMYKVSIADRYTPKQLSNALFLLMRGGINGCALLIHKSHFERVGLFDPDLPTTQDYDLWFRMFRKGTVQYLRSSNVLSRCHENQGSKASLKKHITECDRLWIRMMDELTQEEKETISGSEYAFYCDLWEFLKTSTGYKGAIQHACQKKLSTALKEYERTGDNDYLNLSAEFCGVTAELMKKELLPIRNAKSKKPRIVFQLMDRNAKGGLNRIVVNTADMLSKQYDVIIITWGQPYIHGYQSCPAVKELAVEFLLEQSSNYLNLLSLLKTDIYVYSYCCFEVTLPLLEQIKTLEIKTVAWSHEDYFLPYWRTSLRSSLSSREKYLPEADAVIWLNTLSRSLYGLRHNNGICIPNSLEYKAPRETHANRGNTLVAVGRFDDSRKGLGALLRIFAYIRRRKPDAELYVIGGTDLQLPVDDMDGLTCQEFISREGLTNQYLHFIGWTENVDQYYQKGALHIMPSLYEGFGLVVLEAAANGTPTVAYDGSGMQDIITNQYDGVITESRNWKKMAEEILHLLDNYNLITDMQSHLPALSEKYSVENIRQKWIKLFDVLLSEDDKVKKAYFATKPITNSPSLAKKTLEELDILGLQKQEVIKVENTSQDDGMWQEEQIRKNNEISYWKENYMSISNSTFWKLTKPMRKLADMLKKLFH